MAGSTDLIDMSRPLRELSLEGHEILGKGRSATVYRLDHDRIVKCYVPNVPLKKIQQEMDLAAKAYAAGIPTAQVFELVRVGSQYGVIFELIADAQTVGHVITAHPERMEELTDKFASLWREIHHTVVESADIFPSVKQTWTGWADGMAPHYSESENAFIREMIEAVGDRPTMDHCDYHENNVMVDGERLVLIDMVDIGYGHPIFDLAGLAFRVHCDTIAGRNANRGLSPDNLRRFWDLVLRSYFKTSDTAEIDDIKELCNAYGFLRSALFPMKHVQISEQLRDLHIADARAYLFDRQDWVRSQLPKLNRYFS